MIAVFYYEKQKKLYALLNDVCEDKNSTLCKKVIFLEFISMGTGLLFGLIVVYAITDKIANTTYDANGFDTVSLWQAQCNTGGNNCKSGKIIKTRFDEKTIKELL